MWKKFLFASSICWLSIEYADAQNDIYRQRLKQEIRQFSQLLSLAPNADSFMERAIRYKKIGDFKSAERDYRSAISIDPNNPLIHYNRGLYFRKQERNKEAVASYTRALQIAPKLSIAILNRGITKASMKKYQSAIEDYNRLIKLKGKRSRDDLRYSQNAPPLEDAIFVRGVSYYRIGKFNKAIDHFRFTLELNPNDSGAIYKLTVANLTCKDKNFQDLKVVMEYAKRLVRNSNNKDPRSLELLAFAYLKSKEFPEAEKTIEKLKKIVDPKKMTERMKKIEKAIKEKEDLNLIDW